jgi:hypothetical protein
MDIKDISRIITEDINENNGLITKEALDSTDEWDERNEGDAYQVRIHNYPQTIAGGFKIEPMLERVAALKSFDDLLEEADSSCTTGYNSDSTGFEIFENGFELGRKSSGRDVYMILSDVDPGVALFFVGTDEEVGQRIVALPDQAQ